MVISFKKISEFSYKNVDFYTLFFGENKLTEFEIFLDKEFPNHKSEIELMFNALESMQSIGAKSYFFKDEQNANAIPVVPTAIMDANKDDFGIRLYCIRLTDSLVILINGDIKTHKNPSMCPNVKSHFENALKIAKKLDKLLFNNEINFQETNCLQDLEFEI